MWLFTFPGAYRPIVTSFSLVKYIAGVLLKLGQAVFDGGVKSTHAGSGRTVHLKPGLISKNGLAWVLPGRVSRGVADNGEQPIKRAGPQANTTSRDI